MISVQVEDVLAQTVCVVNAYSDILQEIEHVSDNLLVVLKNWNAEEVDRLFNARRDLFGKLNKYAKGIDLLMEQVRESNVGVDSPERRELNLALDRAGERQESLAKKQSACEKLLSLGLSDCRNQLIDIKHRKGLKQAYSIPRPPAYATFLDSKL